MSDEQYPFGYLRTPASAPFVSNWIRPQEIKKSGSNLLYRKTDLAPVPDRKVLREAVLMGFKDLAAASDEAILEYARRWGVLGLCVHGRPCNHLITQELVDNNVAPCTDDNQPKFLWERSCPFLTFADDDEWFVEPLESWRSYARQLRAILRLARVCKNPPSKPVASIKKTKLSKDTLEDWMEAQKDWQLDNPYSDILSLEPVFTGRFSLSIIIRHWVRVNNIRPVISWYPEAQPSFRLGSVTAANSFLLPVLAVQMMLVAHGAVGFGLCAGCSETFFLSRGQSLYRNSYCIECRRRRVPQQRATERYHRNERKSPNRKKRIALTEKQVASIKRALQKKKLGTVAELAGKYGVSQSTIYKIAEGKSWGSTK